MGMLQLRLFTLNLEIERAWNRAEGAVRQAEEAIQEQNLYAFEEAFRNARIQTDQINYLKNKIEQELSE